MAIELKIPPIGESISEVEIGDWKKAKGDPVQKDEAIVVLESEKATVDLPSPVAGVLTQVLKAKGQTAAIGEVIGFLEEGAKAPDAKPAADREPTPQPVSHEAKPKLM